MALENVQEKIQNENDTFFQQTCENRRSNKMHRKLAKPVSARNASPRTSFFFADAPLNMTSFKFISGVEEKRGSDEEMAEESCVSPLYQPKRPRAAPSMQSFAAPANDEIVDIMKPARQDSIFGMQ